ncbi:MAG TPA: hypothetical protein PKV86_03080 [Syntrophobacteraceae bacterium]|nr:hypothetical protein [Syntrophobacteraceae bacterium]
MKHSGRSFALGFGRLLWPILLMVLVFGCNSISVSPIGHTVPEVKWIALPQSGEYSGTWTNEDLSLPYKFLRNQSQLTISGSVRFADRITNSFKTIQYFHLDALPVDSQGKVLDMVALTTEGNVILEFNRSVAFSKDLTLPPNTASIVFSYRGRAYGGNSADGGGTIDFWEYPVY